MPVKTPLTLDGWNEAIHSAGMAEAAFHRIVSGLLVTAPVTACDRWDRLRCKVGSGLLWLNDERFDRFSVPHGMRPVEVGYDWFTATHAPGNLKRPLARSEWVILGDEVKIIRERVNAVGFKLQSAFPLRHSAPWFGIADAVDGLKSKLDGECYRQHRDWPEFKLVFYGPMVADNPELAASFDVAEANTIRAMDLGEVMNHKPRTRVKHWREILPLDRPVASGLDRPRIYRPA